MKVARRVAARAARCSSFGAVCKLPRSGPYIQVVEPEDATGELAVMYKKYGKPDGGIDNIDKVHSLNPASMESHNALYQQSMKDDSPVTRVEREVIAVVVSTINNCGY